MTHPRDRLETALLKAMDGCVAEMVWGEDDCALWCANIVKDALGYDAVADFRNRYTTKIGSKRVLGKGGLARALKRVARERGWKRIAPQDAQVGDIGFAVTNHSVMICRSPGWFVGRAQLGLTGLQVFKDANKVKCPIRFAWKITKNKRIKRLERPLMPPRIMRRTGNMVMDQIAPNYDAPREPVSLSLLLANLTGAYISVGAVAAFESTALAVGASIGLNYAASALLQRGNQPLNNSHSGANDPSVRYNTRQATPPKRIVYGTAQVGGALFYEQIDRPYLMQGLMLCNKPIKGIRRIWIGTNELKFASISEGGILTPLAVKDQPDYANNLLASVRYGSPDQPIDPLIAANYAGVQAQMLDQTLGTNIGNMTSPSVDAAFDGDRRKTAANSASTASIAADGFVGKDYGVGITKQLAGFRILAPTNSAGFSTSSNDLIRFTLRGSNDGSAWDSLFVVQPRTYDAKQSVQQTLPATTAAYRYFSVLMENVTTSARVLSISQVEFLEPNGFEFRQRGIATVALRYNFGANQQEYTDLWGQVQRPDPICLVDGISIPDPRRSGCILQYNPSDPDAVAEAEATWTWSNNAALCQAHYLTQNYGGKIDPRRVDWDKVAEAADWDDSFFETKSGLLMRRGTLDGLITLNQRPSDVISDMISANRGFVLESAGKVWVSSSKPRRPVATIHDGILAGGIEFQTAKPKRDMINRLRVRATAPDREFQTVDGPQLDRTDLRVIDGEVLDGTLSLPFSLDDSGEFARPQMLQKAFLETSRLGKRINCPVDIRLLTKSADELVGNTVNFSSDLFPKAVGEYFVEKWGYGDSYNVIKLVLSEYDASIETDFNPVVDQQDFTLPPMDLAA